jgi:hypothetical protein
VRRIEENGSCPWPPDELGDIAEVGAKGAFLLEVGGHEDRRAALDVGQIRWELRTETENFVARIEKRLAEKLLEDFGPRADDNVVNANADAVFFVIVGRHGLAEARKAQ